MQPPEVHSPAQAGFTLVEVLVALSVFSLAALALLNAAGENVRTAGAVTSRMFASVVAENRAVELAISDLPPPAGKTEGAEAAAGRMWRWTRKVTATADPAILRIDIAVTPDGERGQAAALTLFKGRP